METSSQKEAATISHCTYHSVIITERGEFSTHSCVQATQQALKGCFL